jgi:hypothetical protein
MPATNELPQNPSPSTTTTQTMPQPISQTPQTNPAFVHDPTFWIIIALAFLFRVILDRPANHRK